MRVLILKRVATNDDGTWGVLIENDQPFVVTLEDPWLDNKVNVSCIPQGTYSCKRTISPRFGEVFEIQDVEGRTHILVHKGNTEDDTMGCILLGERFDYINDKPAILQSSIGFDEFMLKMVDDDEFTLDIQWV